MKKAKHRPISSTQNPSGSTVLTYPLPVVTPLINVVTFPEQKNLIQNL